MTTDYKNNKEDPYPGTPNRLRAEGHNAQKNRAPSQATTSI